VSPGSAPPGPVTPDFGRPVEGGGGPCFHAADHPGCFVSIPGSLELRENGADHPGFRITYVRGSNPMLPPRPYALVELLLGAGGPDAETLRRTRALAPGASVQGALPHRGWLRWTGAPELDLPAGLREPRELAWNEVGRSRARFQLPTAEGDLLRGSLEGGALLISASGWLAVQGRGATYPVRISLSPGDLAAESNPVPREGADVLSRQEVVSGALRLLDGNGVDIEGGGEIPDEGRLAFADALADAFLARHTAPVGPPAEPDGEPGHAMSRSGDPDRWRWTVDLARPQAATRIFGVALDPLGEARERLGPGARDTFVRSVVVPAFDPGGRVVEVAANLPLTRVGVLQLGAILSAPPNPPGRVDPVAETVRFAPPDDEGRAVLRFAPGEAGNFEVTSFAVVRRGPEVVRLDGSPLPGSERILLQPGDFPVTFASVEADPGLLALAEVVLEHFPAGSARSPERFPLTPERPAVALAAEAATEEEGSEEAAPPSGEARLEVEATARDGSGAVLRLGPYPVHSIALGLHLFPAYGPRGVELVLAGSDGAPVAVDLRPEDDPAGEPVTVALTGARPRRRWTYFASSPFRPGYCWRPHRTGQGPSEGWRGPLDPDLPLEIGAETVAAPIPEAP
jgi:hypothetical protein